MKQRWHSCKTTRQSTSSQSLHPSNIVLRRLPRTQAATPLSSQLQHSSCRTDPPIFDDQLRTASGLRPPISRASCLILFLGRRRHRRRRRRRERRLLRFVFLLVLGQPRRHAEAERRLEQRNRRAAEGRKPLGVQHAQDLRCMEILSVITYLIGPCDLQLGVQHA